jgi:uncharacterized membrane protein YheB (UPF0754 family)
VLYLCRPMMNAIMFWAQPFVAAFTGWFTTWVAIWMLFHPRDPKRLFGLTIQGVFPKRQGAIAAKLGSVVANELLHFKEIAAHIKDPGAINALMPAIEQHIDVFLQEKLKEKLPVISMFVGGGTLQKIKEGLMEEIALLLPEVMEQFADNLSQRINIEKMVTEKVSNFSTSKLEEILYGVMKKEFQFIEIIGGVFGFLIGLIQMGLAAL